VVFLKELKFPYGTGVVTLDVPEENLACVVEPKEVPKVASEELEIRKAIDNPIGRERITNLVSKDQSVAIIIDDATRLTPTPRILQLLLRELKQIGCSEERIRIIIGCGLHLSSSPSKQIEEKVGSGVAARIRVDVHDALDLKRLTFMGVTSAGTPAWINKQVAGADLKIGIGTITPHAMAGYGGGAKIILPGVSAWDSVNRNHSLLLSPRSRIGIVENNPMRKDMEEVASIVGLDMIINVVPNAEGDTAKVVAGDYVKAHREGVSMARGIYEVAIQEKADILIMAFGSEDSTLYHVLMGSTPIISEQIVKDGGTIILLAPCDKGIYDPSVPGIYMRNRNGEISKDCDVFSILQSGLDPEAILMKTLRGETSHAELGSFAYLIRKLTRDKKVIVVSDKLSETDLKRLGFECERKLGAVLGDALERHGRDATVIAMPQVPVGHGMMAYPKLAGSNERC
jgi:nickel-dependent lactate racemase